MPLVQLATNVNLSPTQQNVLLPELSRVAAEVFGKPEIYVMVAVRTDAMMMSAHSGPAAFVDVRGIGGFSEQTNNDLSRRICQCLQKTLLIDPERVYLNFTDVSAGNWGWRGETFG